MALHAGMTGCSRGDSGYAGLLGPDVSFSRLNDLGYLAGMYEELELMRSMSEQQRMMFMAQMGAERKSAVAGVLLAFFLGGFGAHRFYLREPGLGLLYLVFCWTFVPGLIAFVECFLMPGRVRQFNSALAFQVAGQVRAMFPMTDPAGTPAPPPMLSARL